MEYMMATTSLKLPDSLKERIAKLAEAAGKTPHAYMVEAIEQEASRGEKYQAFLAEAEASWLEYQKTGIAYAAEDVHAYVRAKLRGDTLPALVPVKRDR
ncbi:MAG TPA: hypothetical protein VGE17_01240 [Methylophilus sp.]